MDTYFVEGYNRIFVMCHKLVHNIFERQIIGQVHLSQGVSQRRVFIHFLLNLKDKRYDKLP